MARVVMTLTVQHDNGTFSKMKYQSNVNEIGYIQRLQDGILDTFGRIK